jgi:hypothetical protein
VFQTSIWGDALELQYDPRTDLKFSDPRFERYDFLNCLPFDVKTCLPVAVSDAK